MTLSQIRGLIRDKLGDIQYSSTTIDAAVNWFINELYNNTRTRQMETTEVLSPLAGATTIPFPVTMQTLINLTVTSPNTPRDIMPSYVEYGDFVKRYPNFTGYSAAQLDEWTDFGNAMRFAAPLQANTSILCEFLRRPVAMTTDTDICELPDVYQELVVLGGLARAMETNEDYAEAAQERDNLAPLVTAFIRNEGRGQIKVGPTIMRTNVRGRGSVYRADRDF